MWFISLDVTRRSQKAPTKVIIVGYKRQAASRETVEQVNGAGINRALLNCL